MVVLAAGQGSRLRSVSAGRPKSFLEIGGLRLIDYHLAVAERIGLEPVVITRPEFADEVRGTGVEVIVEAGDSPRMMITLANTRRHLREPFCWVAGDMLFTDPAPLKEMVEAHPPGAYCSFLFCRTSRFKAKLRLDGGPEVLVTREGEHALSIPNFLVVSPRAFEHLPGDPGDPRQNFLQRGIDRGERVLFREYRPAVFEIDTPADLEEARRFYARCA